MLEEQYVEETAVTRLDGDNVRDWTYIGWINYLFGEHYHMKNYDSWRLFELFHELEESGYGDKYYIKPITTAGFLNRDPDDLIYFWNEKAGFKFSNELYECFLGVKNAI